MATETTCLADAVAPPARLADPANETAPNGQSPSSPRCSESRIALMAATMCPSTAVSPPGMIPSPTTDPAPPALLNSIMIERKHDGAEGQLRGPRHGEPISPLGSDLDDGLPEYYVQQEMSAPAIITTSSPATRSPTTPERQASNLSLPSPAAVVSVQGDAGAALNPGVNCADPCLQRASAETAITVVPAAFSIPAANSEDIARSASFTSPETDPAPQKDHESNREGSQSGNSKRAVARLETPRAVAPAAAPPAQRPKIARCFTASAGLRGAHAARLSRKNGDRPAKNLRALQTFRAQRSPSVNTPAVDGRRGRDAAKTTSAPRSSKAKNGSQALHYPRAPRTAQAHATISASAPRGRYPIIDMEGVPHEVGGLVEESLGLKDPLFARQVEGNPLDSYNRLRVERHHFFPFPPPDMKEYNDEFDRELEEHRPVVEGIDLDLIDRQLDGYARGTRRFLQTMEEHKAAFGPLHEQFLANKDGLLYWNYERQRMITSQYALKDRIGPQARSKRLAQVAAAEAPLIREQEAVQPALKEAILEGRAKIVQALREDRRAPAVIDEMRARAQQRKAIEERDTELGIAGAMMGLRGKLKEQDHPTRTAILQYTQHVVDQSLRWFDEEDKSYRPAQSGRPAAPPLPFHADVVLATVPDWFTILDARGTVELRNAKPLDRFKELMRIMGALSVAAREEEWEDEARPQGKTWDKQYHEPNDGWPNALKRARGGWWTCRSGPDASPAERNCQLCHPAAPTRRQTLSSPSLKDQYQHVLGEIETAMAEASKRDRLFLKYQLQQEREDIARYWQQREWSRSGGGVSVSEVIHSKGVNDLNYRPSAGQPQAGKKQGATTRPGTPDSLESLGRSSTAESPSHGLQAPGQLDGGLVADHLPGFHSLPSRAPQRPVGSPQAYETSRGGNFRSANSSLRASCISPLSRRRGQSPLLSELLLGKAIKAGGKSPQAAARPSLNLPTSFPAAELHNTETDRNVLFPATELHDMETDSSALPTTTLAPSLHRDNSSRAHDVLLGRDSDQAATQAERPKLRSSLSQPGRGGKHKKVSWQL